MPDRKNAMANPVIVTDGMLSEAPEDAVIRFVTKAFETQEAFIFETIRPFCENRTNMTITKDELIRALTLLREQEPAEPAKQHIENPKLDIWYCGECGNWIANTFAYCPWCGKKVKWDAAD